MSKSIILLVEDDPRDEALILRVLRRQGLANAIEVVRDGAEAVEYLLGERGPGPLPTVILLDLKLPRLDGHEVLQRIRADLRTRRLPVVIVSSSDEEEDIARSYDGGANSYVRKPVDFDQFREAVLQLGLYWLLTNQPPPDPGI